MREIAAKASDTKKVLIVKPVPPSLLYGIISPPLYPQLTSDFPTPPKTNDRQLAKMQRRKENKNNELQ